jgi:hypothetical protein
MKFLIQKEGERDWLELDSHHTLKEGKYRIVAESNYGHRDVEISVTYEGYTGQSYQSDRAIHHRRSNEQGLIMVIPYTYLGAGNWEIRCSSDVMSDLLGEGWQVTQQLTILPLCESVSSLNPDLDFYKAQLQELLTTKIEPFLVTELERQKRQEVINSEVITIELENTATNSYHSFDLSLPSNSNCISLDLPEMEIVDDSLTFVPLLSSLPPKLSGRGDTTKKKSPQLPTLPSK